MIGRTTTRCNGSGVHEDFFVGRQGRLRGLLRAVDLLLVPALGRAEYSRVLCSCTASVTSGWRS
ncbi:hypothetical protein CP973_21880 [Streptomyces albofaciens JCM 4342]|nr:hypothetical protein CP973_21880 [Streptomyces albofaciens JCM 4342]